MVVEMKKHCVLTSCYRDWSLQPFSSYRCFLWRIPSEQDDISTSKEDTERPNLPHRVRYSIQLCHSHIACLFVTIRDTNGVYTSVKQGKGRGEECASEDYGDVGRREIM